MLFRLIPSDKFLGSPRVLRAREKLSDGVRIGYPGLGQRGIDVQLKGARQTTVAMILALGVSGFLIWVLLREVPPDEVLAEASRVDLRTFAWVYLFRAFGFAALTWRTRAVASGLYTYGWLQAMRAVFVGYLGNAVLPIRIGELMKIGYLSKVGKPTAAACVGFAAVERIFDLATISLMGLWVFFFAFDGFDDRLVVVLALASFSSIGVMALLARRSDRVAQRLRNLLGARANEIISPRIERFLSGLSALRESKGLVSTVTATLLYWGASLASIAIWPLAFGLELPWFTPLVVLVFLALGTAIPSTAAYVGAYHYAAAAALSLVGAPRETAVAMALFVHAATFVPWTIVAALVCLLPLLRGQLQAPYIALRPERAPE